MFRNVFGGCVSDHSSHAETFRSQKLKFGASLSSALKHGYLPGPLVEILVHIAQEGITTADVFRRPGNPNDTRRIVKRLTEGKQVIYSNYSFYTLASVVKKFLLKIPGGVFTPEGEEQLLQVLTLAQKMDQIEAVHSFIESLAPVHQQLIALLFGTWFRIVTFQEQNCMSLEALSRSVAGSMFHTCAEDPAKVEKASRIMQFLIDNFGVESMFGQENIRFFAETTHTVLHIQDIYHYSYVHDPQIIPSVSPDFVEVTRFEGDEDQTEQQHQGKDVELNESPQPSPAVPRHSRESEDTMQIINTSTLSAPEVSLVPSPEVSKRPKSLEDCLNEVRSRYQSRCLSRFNSVKRKQLERLRQRSDWFLSPIIREKNNSRKGRRDWDRYMFSDSNVSCGNEQCGNGTGERQGNNGSTIHSGGSRALQQKNSGNSTVTKASSEGAVGEVVSDGDSMFTDNTSRSESPASEPVWSHLLKCHARDGIHSDRSPELCPLEMSVYGGSSGADLSIDSHDSISGHHFLDLSPSLAVSGVVEEEEERKKYEGEDEEDDNITPTDKEDEDDTLMASVMDLPSASDEIVPLGQDHEKEFVDPFSESAEDEKRESELKVEYSDSIHSAEPRGTEKEHFIQGQHTSQNTASGTQQQADQVKEERGDGNAREDEGSGVGDQTVYKEDVQFFVIEHKHGEKPTDS